MNETSTTPIPYDRETIYSALESFDETDPDFQAGLATILTSVPTTQIEETKQRAKAFFYSTKHGIQIDFQDYQSWKQDLTSQKEKYPESFESIVQLITSGQTDQIPGIREIPLKINEAEPTKASMQRPSKPWEKELEQQEISSIPGSESLTEVDSANGSVKQPQEQSEQEQ